MRRVCRDVCCQLRRVDCFAFGLASEFERMSTLKFRLCSIGPNRVGLVELVGFVYVFYWESTVSGWFSWSTFSTHSEPGRIGDFRVAFCLCFKASPSTKPFIWKLVLFTCKWNKYYSEIGAYWLKTIMSTNIILFSAVEVGCSLLPGIRPCFQLFQLKTRLKAFYIWYTSTASTKKRLRLKQFVLDRPLSRIGQLL